LKQSREFAALRTHGQRLVCGCLILNWLDRQATAGRRVGVVVSRKVGSAVVRSRARRVMRESWRRNQHRLPPSVDMVLVARNSIARAGQPAVERDFLTAARRAGLLKHDEPAATTGHA
jgi:ribonuclease P protein component